MGQRKKVTQCIQFMALISEKFASSFENLNKMCVESLNSYQKNKVKEKQKEKQKEKEKQPEQYRRELIIKKRNQNTIQDVRKRNQERALNIQRQRTKVTAKTPFQFFMITQSPLIEAKFPLMAPADLRALIKSAWLQLNDQERQFFEKKLQSFQNTSKNSEKKSQSLSNKIQKQKNSQKNISIEPLPQLKANKKQIKQLKKDEKLQIKSQNSKTSAPPLKQIKQVKVVTINKNNQSQIVISSSQQNSIEQIQQFIPATSKNQQNQNINQTKKRYTNEIQSLSQSSDSLGQQF